MSNSGNTPSAASGRADALASRDPDQLIHELSNLLDGSLRNVGLALSRLGDTADGPDATALESLHITDEALRHMADLMRGWQRNSDEALTPSAHARLTDIVDRAVRMVAADARRRDIDLTVGIDDLVAEDTAGRLFPILINGLRNALEAIDREGHVWIDADAPNDDTLEIRISDDGPGIDAKLFRNREGVVLAGQSTKTDSSGRGLGLAICRDVVRSMNGILRMEHRDGGGTILLARIPRPHSPEPPQSGQHP